MDGRHGRSHFLIFTIMIVNTKQKGRCVFAEKPYKKDDVVEVCHYITIPQSQIETLKTTVINDYWFWMNWDQGDALIILWHGSLYNHSKDPNMIPAMEQGTFWFVAIKDIEPGDELVFDYGYTPHFQYEGNLKIIWVKKQPWSNSSDSPAEPTPE